MHIDPVVVLGTGRSGTSLVAAMLDHMGCHMGRELVPADKNNPLGHWEDKYVRDTINQPFLQGHIDEREFYQRANSFKNKRGTSGRRWGWKVPSTATLIDKWKNILHDPLYIHCVRNRDDVLASMQRCYGWSREKAAETYDKRRESIEKHLDSDEVFEVDFDALRASPKQIARSICQYISHAPTSRQLSRATSLVTDGIGEEKKVLISIPTLGHVRAELLPKILTYMGDGRHTVTLSVKSAVPYEANMNQIIHERFLPGEWDYLLTIDDDNPPQRNPLDLLDLNLDILSLPTPTVKSDGVRWCVYDKVGENFVEVGPERRRSLQSVDAAGSGCMLLSRRVLEDFSDEPVFPLQFTKKGLHYRSGDLEFCTRARKRGYRVWAHWDYTCHHVKDADQLQAMEWIYNGQDSYPDNSSR